MACPFPGMDPYLESETQWPAFHHQLIASLYQTLLPGLVDRYRARVGKRQYITEQALFTSVVHQEHSEEFIEIRQRGEDRLVTLIDVISPANKTTPDGRSAYFRKRQESRCAGAHLVEIDLVLQGQAIIEETMDDSTEWDYAVVVTRMNHPDHPNVWTATLQQRLPRFRLPLARDDRDTLVDLQAAFTRCYDQGAFAAKMDYQRDPATTLSAVQRQWLDELLRQQSLR